MSVVGGAVQRSQGAASTGIQANEFSIPNPLNDIFRLNPDNVQEYKVTTN